MLLFGPGQKKRVEHGWSTVEHGVFNVFKKLAKMQSYLNPCDVRHDSALNDGID